MDYKLFDEWANTYNKSVIESDKNNTYPFSGYRKIQEMIYREVSKEKYTDILEMGIGTGEMTKALYQDGHMITGVDFSSKMIEKAKEIMPKNKYINESFHVALSDLVGEVFDCVIFSYSIHHLPHDQQLNLIADLTPLLKDEGIIIIGDVMTMSDELMAIVRENNLPHWDDDEFYPTFEVYQKLRNRFDISFEKVSFCSGVMILKLK